MDCGNSLGSRLKIFMREPLGAIGTIVIPVAGLHFGWAVHQPPELGPTRPLPTPFVGVGLPVLASILIAISAVLSLVTIISIYREGGILKRLRATPLRPHTILTAHVFVKLLLTAATLFLMVLAGRRYYPVGIILHLFAFTYRAADQHVQHFVHRLSDRQHRAHRAVCAAHRRHHHVSDDCAFCGSSRRSPRCRR